MSPIRTQISVIKLQLALSGAMTDIRLSAFILHPRFAKFVKISAEKLMKRSILGRFPLPCHKFIVILHRKNKEY